MTEQEHSFRTEYTHWVVSELNTHTEFLHNWIHTLSCCITKYMTVRHISWKWVSWDVLLGCQFLEHSLFLARRRRITHVFISRRRSIHIFTRRSGGLFRCWIRCFFWEPSLGCVFSWFSFPTHEKNNYTWKEQLHMKTWKEQLHMKNYTYLLFVPFSGHLGLLFLWPNSP